MLASQSFETASSDYWKYRLFQHGIRDHFREFKVGRETCEFAPESGGATWFFDDDEANDQQFNDLPYSYRKAFLNIYGRAHECLVDGMNAPGKPDFLALPFECNSEIKRTSFEINWMLTGVINLSQQEVAATTMSQYANVPRQSEVANIEILENLFPRLGMKLGYHTQNEIGVLTFERHLGVGKYLVSSVNFCPKDLYKGSPPNDEHSLYSTFSRKTETGIFVRCSKFAVRK